MSRCDRQSRGVLCAVAICLVLVAVGAGHALGEEFSKHVVVAQERHAADVGREILRWGGNAVDAAIATAFALAVTHPAAGNLGGGGFLVAYLAEPRRVITIDFRETAPAQASERMYLDGEGKLRPGHRRGAWAAGVPGTVRGLGLAHLRHGSLPWGDLVRPAARLAREGFPISGTLARSLNSQLRPGAPAPPVNEDLGAGEDRMGMFPSSVEAFSKPDGGLWREGDVLRQPDLAWTLERIATDGPDEFYTGRTAELIAAYCRAQGGLISLSDLASYHARERAPVKASYRDCEVYSMGPPSSGGVVIAIMLNILEPHELAKLGPSSGATLHHVTEAMRRAFYVRATELADPDHVAIPLDRLISKEFARDLAAGIGESATPSATLAPFEILPAEGNDTTHLSVLDGRGNAVALTYTLEEGYGCKAVVVGAGFLLNNEMGDFNVIPGRTDTSGRIGTSANLIAPGKRMLSSQTPVIVLRNGRVRLVTGSPGGRTIPNTVLWVLLQSLEFGVEAKAAVAAPRTHHPWFPDVLFLEGRSWARETIDDLARRGHQVEVGRTQGDAHTIIIDPETGQIHGVADPRRRTSRASGD
jgi:gamma-glutamyltranspeptidase/glutathione hydrolase